MILFYAGRLVPEKYPGLLLDVMECGLPGRDLRLLVAGTGILLDALKAEGERRAPGRIHFLGHIGDRNRLADLYANSDLFVPSESA